jgi:uncharacterized protein (DUF1778 family)
LKAKKKAGATAMRERGRRPSQLWYAPEDYDQVQRAARIVRRPMTQFAILAALAEARRVLADNGDKT